MCIILLINHSLIRSLMFFYFKLHLFAFLFNSFLLYVMILSSRYVLIFKQICICFPIFIISCCIYMESTPPRVAMLFAVYSYLSFISNFH